MSSSNSYLNLHDVNWNSGLLHICFNSSWKCSKHRVCEWTFVQTNVPLDQSVIIQQSGDYKILKSLQQQNFLFSLAVLAIFRRRDTPPGLFRLSRDRKFAKSAGCSTSCVSHASPKCGHFSRACIFIKLKRSPRKWIEHSRAHVRTLRLKAHSRAASSDRGWCTTFHDTAWEIINR